MEDNAAIELHDSTLERLDMEADAVVVVLSAYVHRSAGVPGVDPGSGWSQAARIRCPGGRASAASDTPLELAGGRLDLSGRVHDNVIPVPLSHIGSIRLELRGFRGEGMVIEGEALHADLIGEPRYVEDFPGSSGSR